MIFPYLSKSPSSAPPKTHANTIQLIVMELMSQVSVQTYVPPSGHYTQFKKVGFVRVSERIATARRPSVK